MTSTSISLYLLISSLLLTAVHSDVASDRAECTDQLMGLATCLSYVQGNSKAPTPDCCTGLKEVLAKSKKCLCVLIRDRNDPQLGIRLNATLALALPTECGAKANTSHCPELLNLDPNSQEAAVFKQGGDGSTAATPAKGKSTSSSESSGNSSSAAASKESNGATGYNLSYENCFLVNLVFAFGLYILVPLLVSF